MADQDRHVEISLGLNAAGMEQGLEEAERKLREFEQKMGAPSGTSLQNFQALLPSSFAGAESSGSFAPPPPALASFLPSMGGGGAAGGVAQTVAYAQGAGDSGMSEEIRKLVDAISEFRQGVRQEGQSRQQENNTNKSLLEWMKASAILQTGQQVVGQAASGHFFSAAGTGLGGALGMLAMPFAGPAAVGVGATAGGMIGNFIEGIVGGTGSARAFTQSTADMGRRFGQDPALLRDYQLGERFGYTAEQSSGMIDRLREGRVISSAAEGGPLTGAIQELTRALGLNAEAVIDLYSAYTRTGGDKGPEGFRSYMAEVVGAAVNAGMGANIQQYAELMNSARAQSVAQTGNAVSDRAFSMLNDAMSYITGGGSAAAALFRDNASMAGGALQTFLGMGGASPFSLGAGYMRMAGIGEAAIDPRFQTQETQIANAQQMVGWHSDRIASISGMSEAEFNRRAAADPNFVRGQFQSNVLLQRMSTQMLGAQLGRDPTAQDLRAYEELISLSAGNGGRLPTGGGRDSARVAEIMQQFGQDPADQQRANEAARHNRQMEVMSKFEDIMTKMDEWMVNIYDYLLRFDLDAVQEGILTAMDAFGGWVKATLPKIEQFAKDAKAAFDAVIKWTIDNNLVARVDAIFGRIANFFPGLADGGRALTGTFSGQRVQIREGSLADRSLNFFRGLPGMVGGGMNFMLRNGGILPADDSFNDTPPGGVVATPGYNTFRFAPGDVVTAKMGGVPGGTSLADILLFLNNWMGVSGSQHNETREAAGLLQQSTDKTLELTTSVEKNTEIQTSRHWPASIERLASLIGLTEAGNTILNAIKDFQPQLISAIGSVETAINQIMGAMAAGMMGGAVGGAGGAAGAFASGLFTGPSAHIGGSSSYHIDSKFSRSLSWEQIVEKFDQMARAYEEQGRRIEFSNRGVAGEVYDPSAPLADRIRLLQRANAAHSHSVSPNFYSFDYYIPQGDDTRHGRSAEGAEMMLPVVPGGRVEYSSGGRYGNFATIYDAEGNVVMKTGHGDDRRALPQGRSFPNTPPAAAGSGLPGGPSSGNLAVDLIKQFEGFHSTPYWDHQQYSWGYGTRAPGASGTISREQAERELARHLQGVERSIDQSVRVPLNPNQRAALTSFAYNVGEGAFENSTLLRRLNAGDYAGAAAEFSRWTRASGQVLPGLVTRRNAEAELFNRPYTGGPQAALPGRGGNNQIANNFTININAPGGNSDAVARAARSGVNAAVDDFERNWRQDANPRNRPNYNANPALA